jgi:hypothetical protein
VAFLFTIKILIKLFLMFFINAFFAIIKSFKVFCDLNFLEVDMQINNFWIDRINEKNVLKVVEWAHRQGILIENLTISDIIEAAKSYLRDPSHA